MAVGQTQKVILQRGGGRQMELKGKAPEKKSVEIHQGKPNGGGAFERVLRGPRKGGG